MDPISDMFIRIKNAQRAGHEIVQTPYSKLRYDIVRALERAGFVGRAERKGKRVRKILEIPLLYKDGDPLVHDVALISRPSLRLYTSYRELKRSRHGGIIMISTPKGVLNGSEARKEKVGGELIAEVW